MRMKRQLLLLHVCVSLGILLLCVLPVDTKIVFSARQKHLEKNLYHVYAMEDDGSNLRRITDPNHYDVNPHWFPDGKRIVFERDWGEGKWNTGATMLREFFIIDATGMNEHSFMDNHPRDMNPVVSPDRRYIAFHSSREGELDIYTFDLEREELNQLTNNKLEDGFTQSQSWSPDGKQIVYQNTERGIGDNIWIMDADGGRKKRITPIHQGDTILDRGPPRWSSSGKYIMYDEVEYIPEGKTVRHQILIQSVFTGHRVAHNFPHTSVFLGGLAWMGNDYTVLIAYKDPDGVYNIYRYDLNSRKMTKLTDLLLGHAYDPHWVESSLAVSPLDKVTTLWGYLKQVNLSNRTHSTHIR